MSVDELRDQIANELAGADSTFRGCISWEELADALIAGPLAETLRLAAIGRWVEQCVDEYAANAPEVWVSMPNGDRTKYARILLANALAAGASVSPQEPGETT